ncbi:MAG: RNA 2',3'-cyclic phosphodiesterase [Candidatus Omnitrophota bacterium]
MGIRTFIAIEISESLREEFSQLQNELRKSEADVKWVEPKNMHLTLKFLGNTEEKKIEEIERTLRIISDQTKPFAVTFQGLGAFPKLDFPRVIWVGIEKGKEELTQLANKIEKNLISIGFASEKKPYSAHLTLGRVRSFKNKEKLNKIIKEKLSFQPKNSLAVNKISFLKSELTPAGPLYTRLAEFSFSQSSDNLFAFF